MSHSLLIVDDELSICHALKRTFKRHKFNLFVANSGHQALDLLKDHPVDCIVSDQRMPGMKGTELLSIARAQFPDIPRIILSGQSDIKDIEDAINIAKISRFIPKPWDEQQLLEAINETIEDNLKRSHTNNVLPLIAKTGSNKLCQFKRCTGQQNPILAAQVALEDAIKNDALGIQIDQFQGKHTPMQEAMIQWPQKPYFTHQSIVQLAVKCGFEQDLFKWYLHQVKNKLDIFSDKKDSNGFKEQKIIDLFSIDKPSQLALIDVLAQSALMDKDFLIRINMDHFHKPTLKPIKQAIEQYPHLSLILNTEKQLISPSSLEQIPMRYLEMNGTHSTIKNGRLTEKRLVLLNEAANLGIKTILSDGQSDLQIRYAKQLNFDYVRSPSTA